MVNPSLSGGSLKDCKLEEIIRAKVEAHARGEIEQRKISPEELAKLMDVFPSSAYTYLHLDWWPLYLALRIAEAVGLDIQIEVVRSGR